MIHLAGGADCLAMASTVRRAYLASSRQGVMRQYRRELTGRLHADGTSG